MEASQSHHRNIAQWADLPKDILFRIIQYLDLETDLPCFRGVCPTWRSALPLDELPIRKSHIQVPSLGEGNNLPLFLLETRIYLFSPRPSYSASSSDSASDNNNGGRWMARMFETGTNKWHLLDPSIDYNSYCHSYLFTDPPITGGVNLLDCKILDVARPMSLVHELDYKTKAVSRKVVGHWDLTSRNLSVILVQLGKENGGGLVMLKSGDKKWVKVDGITKEEILQSKTFEVLDIAFRNGKFYIFQKMSCSKWGVGIISPGDPSESLQFRNGFSLSLLDSFVYLVPSLSNDCLYIVLNDYYDDYYGDLEDNKVILRLNEQEEYERGEWEPVENLGDEILFIGDDVSFTLHSSALNHIQQWKSVAMCKFSNEMPVDFDEYGIKDHLPQMPEGAECLKHVKYPSYNKYLRYFVMVDGALVFSKTSMEDREVYNRLFFPPPAWIKWCCPSLDNVEVKLDGLRFLSDSDYEDDYYWHNDGYGDYCDDYDYGSDDYRKFGW